MSDNDDVNSNTEMPALSIFGFIGNQCCAKTGIN